MWLQKYSLSVCIGFRTDPIWVPSQLSVCSHTPTLLATTISRFPYNFFRYCPSFLSAHDSPSNLAKSRYPPPIRSRGLFLKFKNGFWPKLEYVNMQAWGNMTPSKVRTGQLQIRLFKRKAGCKERELFEICSWFLAKLEAFWDSLGLSAVRKMNVDTWDNW